jgi:hypothetical protein
MPAKGDGITKRKDGRYMARYTIETPEGPKRKTIYGRKYKEVERKLAEARAMQPGVSSSTRITSSSASTWIGGW